MLPKTAHTSELLNQYSIAVSNAQSPIIYLADETNCFLNLTISYILNINQIYYIPREWQLWQSYAQQTQTQQSRYVNFYAFTYHWFCRYHPGVGKTNGVYSRFRIKGFEKFDVIFEKKKIFWKRIIQWQKSQSSSFEALQVLGVNSSKDYENILYEKLQILNVQVVGKTLVKNFQSYSEAILNIQQVFYSDIIQSILKIIPSSTPDYILRGYFPGLLDKCSDHAKKANEVQRTQKENCQNLQIVLLRSSGLRETKQYPSFQTHGKTFSISMAVLIGIYIIGYLRNEK